MGHSSKDHRYFSPGYRRRTEIRRCCRLPQTSRGKFGMRGEGPVEKSATNGDASVLPSFFVIGPPRTGTSWLHEVLSKRASLSHPTKETRFFDRYFDRGLE